MSDKKKTHLNQIQPRLFITFLVKRMAIARPAPPAARPGMIARMTSRLQGNEFAGHGAPNGE